MTRREIPGPLPCNSFFWYIRLEGKTCIALSDAGFSLRIII